MRTVKSKDDEDYFKKKEMARRMKEYYIPRGIEKVRKQMPEDKIAEYMSLYSYELSIRKAKSYLVSHGIRDNNLIFDECLSDAGLVYMYAAYRCAYCGYKHFWGYFYFMMRLVLIWSYYLCDDSKAICMNNNLRHVYLDSETVNL